MTQFVTQSGLVIEGKLADTLVEERAQELFRQFVETLGDPVSFSTRQNYTPVGLGAGPTAGQLLDEQRGWPAVANRATMDRIQGLDWFGAERVFDRQMGKWTYDPVPDHIINDVLHRPNPMMSGRKLKMLIAGLVQHTGAAYLQKIRDGIGVVRELWPIPTQKIEPVSANGMVIGAYRVLGSSGKTTYLDVEDVVRIWRPDLRSIWGQLGTLGPQALEYDALKFMTEHLRSYFQLDGTPRVALLGRDGAAAPEPEDRKKFLSAWRRAHNRRLGTQVGLPAFIPAGFDIHEFNGDQVDTGMAEFEDRWARQIMAAAGVPRFAVGIDTNTNRATGETVMWAWDQNANKPLTDLIADDLTTQFAQPDYYTELAVRFEDFVARDKEFDKSQEDQDLARGVRTVNQVREARDMTPVSWGDLPRGTLAEVPYTGDAASSSTEDPADLAADAAGDRVIRSPQRVDLADFFSPDAVWARNLQVEQKWVTRFQRAQLRVWDAQRLEARRKLAALADVDPEDLRAALDGNARDRRRSKRKEPKLERSFTRAITADDIFQLGTWLGLYNKETGSIREALLEAAALDTAEAIAPDITEFVLSGFMQNELATQGAQHVTRVDNVTRKRLAQQLSEAQATGESIQEIAKRVDVVFQDRKRSKTVARTEVGAANQAGTLEGYRLTGAVKGKQWNTSRDDRVRDSHEIDGQEVALESRFLLNSGVTAAHPLERSLPVEEIANCRCFMTPVLIEEPEE